MEIPWITGLPSTRSLAETVLTHLGTPYHFELGKKTMRDIHNRWEKIGHVPRDWMQKLEDRLKLVETAIKEADIKEVSRKDPDKQARANSTLSLFTEKINKLEKELTKAQDAGNSAKVSELITAIEGQKLLLSAVEETLTDFAR